MATTQQIKAAVVAIVARANIASDESKLAIGDSGASPVVDPLINGVVVQGSFPRGVALGSDTNGSKIIRALVEGLADYFLVACIPSKTVLSVNLTAPNITSYFDGTGLGLATGLWYGWAICNGSNGTPNLSSKFPRLTAGAAGTTGGSDSGSTGTPSTTTIVSSGTGATVASSTHTHIDNNRPAFHELTAVMKL